MSEFLYHIVSQTEWNKALDEGVYSPESLDSEGFIHFSTRDQVLSTAQRYYAGRTDLLLLKVDSNTSLPEVKFENTVGGTELFPHMYGKLSINKISGIAPLKVDSATNFVFPNQFPAH